MTPKRLQELAVELSTLDREKEYEYVRAIENEICAYEIGMLKEINGRAYFPLLGSVSGMLPYEDFWNIFINALLHLLKNYNPEKAKFSTALMFIVRNRLKDYYGAMKKRGEREESFESLLEKLEELGKAIELADPVNDYEEVIEKKSTEFEVFLRLASIISSRKEQEKHLSKTKRNFYEGFYTFDTTALTKSGLFEGEEVIESNGILFPIMELVVLEYLLEGTFGSMRDVVNSAVRDQQRLNQRNETIGKCYNLAGPTVSKRKERYSKLFDAFRPTGYKM